MTYMPPVEMIELFKKEVHDRAGLIDPGCEEDWKSLTIGWAVAKGMSLEVTDPMTEVSEVHNFALYIRYYTDLG